MNTPNPTATDLDTRLMAQGVFSCEQIWGLLRSVLPALQQLHQARSVYACLQPELIVGVGDREFALLPPPKLAPISPEYAAPEQLPGAPIAASDIYSLGVICLHLLTGIAPFELWDSPNQEWLWQPYLKGPIDPLLGQVLSRMVAIDLADRYADASAVLQALGLPNLITTPPPTTPWQCVQILSGHRRSVTSLAIDPIRQRLYSGSEDPAIGIWDRATGQSIGTWRHHRKTVTDLALHPSGDWLASASDDQTIGIWDITTGTIVRTLVGHRQAVKAIGFTPDGTGLVSGSWDKSLHLWNWQTGDIIRSFNGHRLQIGAIAIHPNGQQFASGSHDRTTRIWDLATGQTTRLLEGHDWAVTALAYSPDGDWLATGSHDRTIKIWDSTTGHLAQTLSGHAWDIACLTWLDANTLISGSWNPAIKIWDWRSGTAQSLNVHDDAIADLVIDAVNGEMITGSRDRVIKIWAARG